MHTIAQSTSREQVLTIIGAAALTGAAAHVTIPHYPVPYTLQTLVVLVSGAVLGMRHGAAGQLVYLALGACGLPVFAHVADGTFGIVSFIGPTGGYLLAFPLAAGLVGWASERYASKLALLASMVAATGLIFLLGTIQLNIVLLHDWNRAFAQGFLIFSWWDVAKISLAFVMGVMLRPQKR